MTRSDHFESSLRAANCDALPARLAELGIKTVLHCHPPLFTVAESRALRGHVPGAHSKNLFLKDKAAQIWLVTCLEDARIDLKSLSRIIGSARLSFASPELLAARLGVIPGAVSPFALINDRAVTVRSVLQAAMMRESLLNFHPLDNTATLSISADDLLRFICSCGHQPQIADI